MNWLDRMLLSVSPGWAASRLKARYTAGIYAAAYDAAEPGRLRKRVQDYGSGNAAVAMAGTRLRDHARHQHRNHDIVRNGLNRLVQNVIGGHGIGIEPQPRNALGDIDEDLAFALQRAWREWCKRPEVTWQHDWPSALRLLALTYFRDGEALFQELVGPVPMLDHGTQVPYSIELIEPDLLPLDLNDPTRGIMQGVERNAWGRPIAFHLYKTHPGDPNAIFATETKRVSADRIRHMKLVDRIGQVRGVSVLSSVLTRLEDLKDYEESERIAAKIAASMAAVIIKGQPEHLPEGGYLDASGNPVEQRHMRFQAGMIFDDLRPGEDVKTIDSNRPNPNLEPHRNGQLRAVSGGIGISYSSLSNNFNGTYSAQRQELVEQYGAYGVVAGEVIHQCCRPVYERFVATALATGVLGNPLRINTAGLADALYLPPQMPWIDPLKEANAMEIMEENAYMSGPEIIRRRGASPNDVLDQQSAWLERKRLWNIPARGETPPRLSPDSDTEGTA